MKLGSKRIPELDGLRGLAIALVILFHLELLFPVHSRLLGSAMLFGWSGVDLFFVLSGFLIGGILLEHRDTANYFRVFYARRFFRIVPVYFAVVALFAIAWMIGGEVRGTLLYNVGPPMPWYTYLSFTNNLWIARHDTMHIFLPVSWSLAVEEQFYLTLPLVVRLLPRKALLPAVSTVALLVAGFRAWSCWQGLATQNQAYVLPFFRADALLIGVLCALLVRNEHAREWLQRNRWALPAAALVLAAATIRLGTALPPAEAAPRTPLMMFGLTLIAMFYATLLLMAVVHPWRPLSAALRFAPLRFLGNVSYCVYLIHEGALNVFAKEVWPHLHLSPGLAWPMLAVAVAVILGAAQISWKALESKMIRIGHQFTYRYSEAPVSSVVATATADAPAA